VVVDGKVAVERGGKRIAVKGPGDFLGELALVTGRPRTATVTATTPLRALVVDGLSFDRLLRDVPAIAEKVNRAVAERQPADHV
jgi:CRP-like cAMP-binding protein